jgi:hypothetical protein
METGKASRPLVRDGQLKDHKCPNVFKKIERQKI